MAYYAAVISLKHTIRRLLNSSQISIHPSSKKILQIAFEEVRSLQEVVQRVESSRKQIKYALGAQIREAACKLEDAIGSLAANSQTEGLGVDEDSSLEDEIYSFVGTMKKMKKTMELGNTLLEVEDDNVLPSRMDFDGEKPVRMVGLSDEFNRIKDLLIYWLSPKLEIVSLVGMAGIGKTTLVKKVYLLPEILEGFSCRAWVTMGPNFQAKKILLDILAQIGHDIDKVRIEENELLAKSLYTSLQGRRYLLVLDDIWNKQDWYELKKLLPNDNNGSRVLLTTRLQEVAYYAHRSVVQQVRFLSKEESWDLLCEKVFGEKCLCPLQLEKAGKKIAEKCEGLPLAIITVARLLCKADMTPEYWNKIAGKDNSIFIKASEEMSKVLFPSYKYLPPHLKPCFLYMGVFPPSHEISASKLIRLWIAEEFLEPNSKYFAKECLEDLVSRSLVLIRQLSSRFGTKTCSLHSVSWHLCTRQASKEKFFHLINSYPSSTFTEGIESQRRLCTHNNVLFSFKEVRDSMESISTARSLLCTGTYHQYQVRICFGLTFLKILDALTIRFYKFPIEVLELVCLKYLALTCNGMVPGSISILRNLEYFIIRQHLRINKSNEDRSYLPIEIWHMQGLRHLQVMGSDLPDHSGAILSNLLTLSDTSMNTCSKEILERIPNLKKLGIQIELVPGVAELLCCFDHLSLLKNLESLKCVVANPNPMSQVVGSITAFPSSLKKLSLSGLGYPWEYMSTIGKLRSLQVLKLRCYAFRGPKWVTYEEEFKRLKFLLIEDIDLVHWRSDGSYCFESLQRLIIKHCYKLKEMPSGMGGTTNLEMIELVDSPTAVPSVEQIQEEKLAVGNALLQVCIRSSWDEKKPRHD